MKRFLMKYLRFIIPMLASSASTAFEIILYKWFIGHSPMRQRVAHFHFLTECLYIIIRMERGHLMMIASPHLVIFNQRPMEFDGILPLSRGMMMKRGIRVIYKLFLDKLPLVINRVGHSL